ncbi:tRNA1(Val) (adenine(37)-N6)-methyltransferase [Elioraea sp.]|uniref:tRNA1(Val) (adenine(37)-N6)-methyltransferase n=1 Tax=Elioraea sp. TaxID=2185103 RepID=UPI003F6EC8EB
MTEDALLGGRVRLCQPAEGFRAAIDPVLLAAAVPARPGDRVLEAGTGSGAAALCLLARVAGARVVGIERNAALAELARTNAALNGNGDRFLVVTGDLATRATARAAAAHGACAHAMANPPFHLGGTVSPLAPRREAGHESAEVALALWVAAMARRLAPRGTLTLVLPPARLPDAIAALGEAGIGGLALLPLWPRAGAAARRVIVQGIKGGRAPCRLLPGVALHRAEGGYTDAAERVLREADALALS